MLDNQGVVKATPVPCRGVGKDQDYRDSGYRNVTTKNLTVRWTPGHPDLRTATTYQDYIDIQGTNESDTFANMGDNLPMDTPPPQPHDIVLHGHIMPTPAKSWILQLRRQKQTTDVHWISWIPLKHYRRSTWLPWLWGQVRWWGQGASWERIPTMCGSCGLRHGSSMQMRLAHCPSWAIFWTEWEKWWNDWATYAKNWLLTAPEHDRWLCARLLIPKSLLDTILQHERHRLCLVAGLFQFRAILGVQGLSR